MTVRKASARPIRIARLADDPGYRLWACMGPRQRAGLQVLVDGELVKIPLVADEGEGRVVALVANGHGTSDRTVMKGRVEIRSTDRCYLEVLWAEARSR